jgi:hypothetical protein
MGFNVLLWVDRTAGAWTWIRDGKEGEPGPEPRDPQPLRNWFDAGWKIAAAQQLGDAASHDLLLLLRHPGGGRRGRGMAENLRDRRRASHSPRGGGP